MYIVEPKDPLADKMLGICGWRGGHYLSRYLGPARNLGTLKAVSADAPFSSVESGAGLVVAAETIKSLENKVSTIGTSTTHLLFTIPPCGIVPVKSRSTVIYQYPKMRLDEGKFMAFCLTRYLGIYPGRYVCGYLVTS